MQSTRDTFVGWPGLTADRFRKFCKQKEETAKGHMRQLPSNIRSTQKDLMPLPQQKLKSNIRRIGAIAFDETQMKNMIGVDFMGRYPTESRDGNKYILIMYDYDINYIRGVPVASRKAEVYLKAFKTMFDELTTKDSNLNWSGWIMKRPNYSVTTLKLKMSTSNW